MSNQTQHLQFNMANTPNISNIDPTAAAAKANALKEKASDIAKEQKAKLDKAKDELKKKKDLITKSTSIGTSGVKKKIIALLIPIFLNFVRKEGVINAIIKTLKKSLKKRLQKEGVLNVVGLTFIFTPRDYAKWSAFKDNFDKKVNSVKTLINTLDNIITQLQNILVILNASLTALQLIITLSKTKIIAKRAKIAAELALPTPSKPTVAIDLTEIDTTIDKLNKAQEKIEEYHLYITIAQSYVMIFKSLITKLKLKVNQLQLIIVGSNMNTSITLDPILVQQPEKDTPETEYISDVTYKSYTLKLITYPDGSAQYQALDAFSKMKVTQTAPSKVKTTDQLLDEIKQILG